jgi:adenylate kinase
MDIVLFGIQGSGKGTLGKVAAQKYGYKYFETGGQLRILSQENSPLGKKVKEIIEAGHLVPNEIVMEIIEDFMKKIDDNAEVIFDGIPRKIDQANSFEALERKIGREFTAVLVDIPEEMAIKRLTTRRLCSKCKEVYPADYSENTCKKCGGELITRSDDNPESIKTRLEAYFTETTPVINRYKQNGKLIKMDGKPAIPEAAAIFFNLIEKNFKK